MRIVVASDNHGDQHVLQEIKNKYKQNGVLFVHCGDSEGTSDDVEGFIAVRGNNDYDLRVPYQRNFEIEDKVFYVTHGHKEIMFNDVLPLSIMLKEYGVNIVFFGHSHVFFNQIVNGVHFINPGSLHYNRDRTPPSYALVDIDEEGVRVTRCSLDDF